ncbi:hypothetical protein IJ21_42660 [Paenibacillus sp. 32O-W]|uniref:hypothetical protein n=1 Tax=Paenibacillus sp. 32O-W TaxID=1695218 RepID=UPI000721B5CF|nr:hypothetical protein [Paenibacillus sp. 32O-W]ALS29629.1 hypothetical protein IJ21_42660 [Paenibacillus sp. 32O-W]
MYRKLLVSAIVIALTAGGASALAAAPQAAETAPQAAEQAPGAAKPPQAAEQKPSSAEREPDAADGKVHKQRKECDKDREAREMARLQYVARYFGLPVEGKTKEQLREEIRKAKEANKDKWEELKKELRKKHLEKLRNNASRS